MIAVAIAMLIAATVLTTTTTTTAYAGGAALDYDERYEHIPGAPQCWFDGYADGEDSSYNQDKGDECKDKGNQYYVAFIYGCLSVEGNTKDVCESATDAD